MEFGRRVNLQRREASFAQSPLAFHNVEQLVDELALPEASVVLDLAAGSGLLALALARQVGRRGIVYALDLSPEIIAHAERGVVPANVRPMRWKDQQLPLGDGSVDAAILAFALGAFADGGQRLTEAQRVVRAEGRVIVLESDSLASGPDSPSRSSCEESLRSAGFDAIRSRPLVNGLFVTEGRKRA